MSPVPRRGAKALLAATGVAQVFTLIRFTLLARLLGPEQLGLAAAIMVTANFFDVVTDNGADRFLIQDQDGDTESAQKTVQLVSVGRGVFTAIALLLVAGPLAAFYKAPALTVGFMALGLAPLIGCLGHFDNTRAQRRQDFRTAAVSMLVGETLSLLATSAAALLTHSFLAILFGLVARSVGSTVVTHLRAERPYRLGIARDFAARLLRFGAPLMVNGVLLFASSQGDRVLVANRLGLAALGHYSAVILLIYYPSGMLQRYMSALSLPRIAAERGGPESLGGAADRLAGQTLLLAVSMAAGFALVAPVAVVVLDSAKFSMPAIVVGLVGILQCSRFLRLWPVTIAMANGRSGIALADTTARLIAIPAALLAIATFGGLAALAGGFIVGEVAALVTVLPLVNRARGLPLFRDFDRVAIFLLSSAAIVGWTVVVTHFNPLGLAAVIGASAAIALWLIRREKTTIVAAAKTAARILQRSSPGVWRRLPWAQMEP